MSERENLRIIFYDGDCALCHWAVQFVLKRDKRKIFYFAPLQGEAAQKEVFDYFDTKFQVSSVILLEIYSKDKRRIYRRGRAALRICWYLPWAWKLLGIFSFLPAWLVNPFYDLLAKYRFKLFGKSDCLIPVEADRERFLP